MNNDFNRKIMDNKKVKIKVKMWLVLVSSGTWVTLGINTYTSKKVYQSYEFDPKMRSLLSNSTL